MNELDLPPAQLAQMLEMVSSVHAANKTMAQVHPHKLAEIARVVRAMLEERDGLIAKNHDQQLTISRLKSEIADAAADDSEGR